MTLLLTLGLSLLGKLTAPSETSCQIFLILLLFLLFSSGFLRNDSDNSCIKIVASSDHNKLFALDGIVNNCGLTEHLNCARGIDANSVIDAGSAGTLSLQHGWANVIDEGLDATW